jgi:hypothetical protein
MQPHTESIQSSGFLVKAGLAGHQNDNSFDSDELETICDLAIAHRAKWRSRAAKKASCPAVECSSSGDRPKPKVEYTTLAEALAARSSMARKRGKRHKRLPLYKVGPSWFLTKMRKGQARSFVPVCPR